MSNEKKISKTEQQLNLLELEVSKITTVCMLHTFGEEKATENLKESVYKEVLNIDDMVLKEIFQCILKLKALKPNPIQYSGSDMRQLIKMGQTTQSTFCTPQDNQDLSDGDMPVYINPFYTGVNRCSSNSCRQCGPSNILFNLMDSAEYAHVLRYIHNIVTEASTKLKKV